MTKRLVEIDDDLLAEAQRLLDQPTIRATVETALREATALVRRREALRAERERWERDGGGLGEYGTDHKRLRDEAWR